MAPTYPECDRDDLLKTLKAIAKLKPLTVFHEPINIRAENVSRIEAQAKAVGLKLQSDVFATRDSWRKYALQALKSVWELSEEAGLREHIHLWPDNPLTLLNLRRLPARVDYQGASVLLHFEPLAIKILVNLGHLKPLGNPQRHEHKYFSSSMLLKLGVDEKWLHEATRLLKRHWAQRNGRKTANIIRMQTPLLSSSDGLEQNFESKGKKHDR